MWSSGSGHDAGTRVSPSSQQSHETVPQEALNLMVAISRPTAMSFLQKRAFCSKEIDPGVPVLERPRGHPRDPRVVHFSSKVRLRAEEQHPTHPGGLADAGLGSS